MPFLFLTDPHIDDGTVRNLNIVYDFNEMIYSDESGWEDESRLDSMNFAVTLGNMITFLSTQYYCDFPMALNVDSWDINVPVNIGSYGAIVVDSGNKIGYNCWTCLIGVNESTVSYDQVSGVLVDIDLIDTEYRLEVQLQEMSFGPRVQPYVKDEGVLLTAIFIELAVIVFLLSDRRKKSK
jgi:hypothetical protein